MSVCPSLSSATFNKTEVAGDDAYHTDPNTEGRDAVGLNYLEVQQILQLVNV